MYSKESHQSSNVFVLGTLACDAIHQVDALPSADGFCLVRSTAYQGGGSAANVAVQLSRLDCTVHFAGCIGDDENGKRFRQGLIRDGMDVSLLSTQSKGVTTRTDIYVDPHGERVIALDMGDAFFSSVFDATARSALEKSQVLYTDLLPKQAALDALQEAQKSGLRCAIGIEVGLSLMHEFGWEAEELLRACAQADVLFPCAQALRDLGDPLNASSPQSCARKLCGLGVNLVVATQGSEGSLAVDQAGKLTKISAAHPVPDGQIVDTTGAGDSYTGAFIWAHLLQHNDLLISMEYASACAYLTCTRPGARTSPSLSELKEYLQAMQASNE